MNVVIVKLFLVDETGESGSARVDESGDGTEHDEDHEDTGHEHKVVSVIVALVVLPSEYYIGSELQTRQVS